MISFKYFTFLSLSLFISLSSHSQLLQKYNSVPVIINGSQLEMPWAGGLNSPVFQATDLNGDGIRDLVLFEKQSGAAFAGLHRITTYLNNGIPNQISYTYAPQYEDLFPNTLHDWMLLVDYNCDGHEDIFTYNTIGGIQVFRNNIAQLGTLSFSQDYSFLDATFLGGSIAPVNPSAVNQPVLIDVNFDGDLDILNFETIGGNIEYFENMAQETFARCDTFVLTQLKACWGHLELNSFSNTAQLGACSNFQPSYPLAYRNLHSGSCMIGFDHNTDLDVDLINGDILGNNLLYLQNSYTSFNGDFIVSQDSAFPSYNVPVNYQTFPAPYLVDVDNDNDRDLIVSSCSEIQSENFDNIMLYQNTTNDVTYNFNFVKRRFLADQMIDIGSGANVCLADVDADGLTDMLIGNYGKLVFGTPSFVTSSIAYFRNTGSISCPQFDLITYDYAGIASLGLAGVYPTTGDVDGDGDLDLVCGTVDGILFLFNNSAGAGNPMNVTLAANGINWQGIDVGSSCAPQLFDVNADGLLDLVIGNAIGKIQFYSNSGTASVPAYSLQSNFWGGINVGNTATGTFGYATPLIFYNNGSLNLLVGSLNGLLALYDNISGNLAGTFNLASDTAYGIIEHYRSSPARADLNNDGNPEFIVGCFAGGVSFYSQFQPCLTSINEHSSGSVSFLVFPNPAKNFFTISPAVNTNNSYSFSLYNSIGKLMLNALAVNNHTIDCSSLPKGIYLLKINSPQTITNKKIIIQ